MRELSKFGYTFQIKIIVLLLTDRRFNNIVLDILKPSYFDGEALMWVVSVILEHYKRYYSLATIDIINAALSNYRDKNYILADEVAKIITDIASHKNSSDLEYIREKTIEFCKNRALSIAILKSSELLQDGDYDGIKKLIDSAIKVGIDTSDGIDYSSDIELRYTENKRNPVPTGLPVIDTILQGGLSAGDIGFIVGAGGSGKSWVLSTISANMFKSGYNVLYISLELNASYVGIRHDCILTGLSTDVLPEKIDYIKKVIKSINTKGTLRLEWYPTRTLSLIGLRSLIDRRILLGYKPDVLIIDYVDLMKLPTNRHSRKDELLQELCEELRGLGGEYDMPVWTASQANRSAHGAEVEHVDAAMIAESMGKHYTADFMLSILRKKKDILHNRARFHVIKNRYGDDQFDLVGKLDTTYGILEIYGKDSKEAQAMQNDIVETETDVRRKIANLYMADKGVITEPIIYK